MDHIKKALDGIVRSQARGIPDFVWNILEIKNVENSAFNVYYDFIRDYVDVMEGDIVELGVYRGGSLLSTALLLKALGSKKKVYGFDTFSGFPAPHPNDDKARFEDLFKQGRISAEHYEYVKFKIDCEKVWPREHVFDNTSLDFVRRKIDLFGLDNVVIVVGDLTQNMAKLPPRIMATLYDCDLYSGYADTLPATFDRTVNGGILYLDEYYSLKYPGPRIAVDDFCAARSIRPIKSSRTSRGQFERWYLQK